MQETREADPEQEQEIRQPVAEEMATAALDAEAAQALRVAQAPGTTSVSVAQAGSPEPASAQVTAETRLQALLKQSAGLMDHLDQLGAADGETAIWRDGLYWLRYPDWFATVGWSPQVAAEALSADGLIESDPATPMRRVRDHAGARWIVLTPVCSEALRAWLDALPSDLPAEVPERPSRAPRPRGQHHPSMPAKPAQRDPHRHRPVWVSKTSIRK